MEIDLTGLLELVNSGDKNAMDQVFQIAYGELHQIAKNRRRQWNGNDTLNTTALIHEAFVKLTDQKHPNWQNRVHFYAAASKAMRHILVNYSIQQKADKRGGGAEQLPLMKMPIASADTIEDVLGLHQALERLETERPRLCQIVECRFFGGMTIDETSEALAVSSATVTREWKLALALLYENMSDHKHTLSEIPA